MIMAALQAIDVLRSVQEGEKFTKDAILYYPATGTDFYHPNVFRGSKVFVDSAWTLWQEFERSLVNNYRIISEEHSHRKHAFDVVDGFKDQIKVVYYLRDANEFFPPELEKGFDIFIEKNGRDRQDIEMNAKIFSKIKVGGFAFTAGLPVLPEFLADVGFGETEYTKKDVEFSYFFAPVLKTDFHAIRKLSPVQEETFSNFFKVHKAAFGIFALDGCDGIGKPALEACAAGILRTIESTGIGNGKLKEYIDCFYRAKSTEHPDENAEIQYKYILNRLQP